MEFVELLEYYQTMVNIQTRPAYKMGHMSVIIRRVGVAVDTQVSKKSYISIPIVVYKPNTWREELGHSNNKSTMTVNALALETYSSELNGSMLVG